MKRIVLLLALLFLTGCGTTAVAPTYTVSSTPTPHAHCQALHGLPDVHCTPGAIFPVTTQKLCVSGYTRSVRNVPDSEKAQVFAEYGVTSHATGQYEVDHLIPLELGGSNALANLWPEAAAPTPGFHQKDQLENYLHDRVCSGAMSLKDAQHEIAVNWIAAYDTMRH